MWGGYYCFAYLFLYKRLGLICLIGCLHLGAGGIDLLVVCCVFVCLFGLLLLLRCGRETTSGWVSVVYMFIFGYGRG